MSDTHAEAAVAFVRTEAIPPSPPPPGETGVVHWLRTNLFSSVGNSIMTVLALLAIYGLLQAVVPWLWNGIWDAESIRDEKVKLLKSIKPILRDDVARNVVRGQYLSGEVDDEVRRAYRREEKVNPHSNVETYVALKLFVDNWRWSGVPVRENLP